MYLMKRYDWLLRKKLPPFRGFDKAYSSRAHWERNLVFPLPDDIHAFLRHNDSNV